MKITISNDDKVIQTAEEPVIAQTFVNRNPSEWVLTPLDGNMIEAYNNTSRERFTGTILEFNQLLRG